MTHRTLPFASLLLCFAVAACSDTMDTDPAPTGSGGGAGASSSSTGSSTSSGSSSSSGGSQIGSGPLATPKEQWTWVPFGDAFCANGKETGIGVNLTDKSKRALIYLAGGGACWSEATCYGATPYASNIKDGYGEANFAGDASQFMAAAFFDRSDAKNPFKDYSFIFVPYCTGDVHAGSNTLMYGDKMTSHVGFNNMGAYLKRIVPTFVDADRVFLAGSSAGGFGALINWGRTQDAFGTVRVDLIDDSGTPMPSTVKNPFQEAQRASWNLDAAAPPDCATCKMDQAAIFDFYGKKYPDHRGALLSFTQDTTLSQFSLITPADFEKGLNEMTKAQIDPNPSLRYFLVSDMKHVLWFSPTLTTNTVSLQQWLTQMVTDDVAWTSQHP
jgi:hypothetical protein